MNDGYRIFFPCCKWAGFVVVVEAGSVVLNKKKSSEPVNHGLVASEPRPSEYINMRHRRRHISRKRGARMISWKMI
jgi:hypothetical protein